MSSNATTTTSFVDDNKTMVQVTTTSAAASAAGNTNSTTANAKLPVGPLCWLTPCTNSHPFEERRIVVTRTEESSVKIGRSVVRVQPSPNNAIFDCKVLSRNHAILWLNKEGQFLIKDTRSSNGTFINNERLSASGEESEPRELFSGDILQLGVEIVDNAKKVASGCVTCIVRLINERGEECAGRAQNDPFSLFPIRSEQQIPQNYSLVRNDKFFILDQYIKEAKFRENLLGQKLQTLEEHLQMAQDALQVKWEEQINQELLLSRIELLESQLLQHSTGKKTSATTTNNNGTNAEGSDEQQSTMKQEMQHLMEDRAKAEQMAKESLREKLEQMQETSGRLHDVEMSLANVEEECTFLRQRCADYEDQFGRQRRENEALSAKYNEVCAQLSAAEKAGNATGDVAIEPEPAEQPAQLNGTSERAQQQEKQANDTKMEEKQQQEQPSSPSAGHQCQESELKSCLVECQSELAMARTNYAALLEKFELVQKQAASEQQLRKRMTNNNKDSSNMANGASPSVEQKQQSSAGSSSADFQMFLLSALPFLLIAMLIFSPMLHFFGLSNLAGGRGSPVNNSEDLDEANGGTQEANGAGAEKVVESVKKT